jgi:hypothetical protein
MTQQHPITPPPELVQKWGHNANLSGVPHNDEHWAYEQHIATRAAQWGADQELEACCEWLQDPDLNVDTYKLRTARRPKPPSLKEQALKALQALQQRTTDPNIVEPLRRALEQLDD